MTGEKRFEALAHNGPHPRLTTRTMSLDWTGDLGRVDWEELSALYRAAPLGDKPAEVLRQAFSNSMFRCFAYDGGRLVGAGRALADGVDCAYLCDIAVLPSHQGTGLGRQIVARLLELARGHKKILLYAVPGTEAFYMRFGFLRMRTAMAIFANQAQQLERGYLDPG
jgi:GNAT superfamily N-acetyltransferase